MNPVQNKNATIQLGQFMHRNALLFVFLLLSLTFAGCTLSAGEPKPAPTESTSLLLYSGPFFGFRRFGFSGIAFMGDKLFVGTERGLYEVIDGKIAKRFNWMPEWDVIENPFYDRVNACLWFEHTGVGKLIRFDGENWSFVSLPGDERSRGDALAGFRMFNSRDRLYTYSPQGIWEWTQTEGWRKQAISGLNCAGERPGESKECFLMAGAIGDDLVVVIRHDASSMSVLLPDTPNSTQYDQICILTKGICSDVPNPTGKSFFVKEIVGGNSKAFILTYQNELFAASASGLEQLPSPGIIDQILQTDSQALLATSVSGEILEYTGEWKRLTVKPFAPESAKKVAYVAEHNGKIAYAIAGYDLTVFGDCNIRGQSALWIIQSEEDQCVGL